VIRDDDKEKRRGDNLLRERGTDRPFWGGPLIRDEGEKGSPATGYPCGERNGGPLFPVSGKNFDPVHSRRGRKTSWLMSRKRPPDVDKSTGKERRPPSIREQPTFSLADGGEGRNSMAYWEKKKVGEIRQSTSSRPRKRKEGGGEKDSMSYGETAR